MWTVVFVIEALKLTKISFGLMKLHTNPGKTSPDVISTIFDILYYRDFKFSFYDYNNKKDNNNYVVFK